MWFQALIFADGILMAGSMEALIQHLVPTDEYNPDVRTINEISNELNLFICKREENITII